MRSGLGSQVSVSLPLHDVAICKYVGFCNCYTILLSGKSVSDLKFDRDSSWVQFEFVGGSGALLAVMVQLVGAQC